MKKTKVKDIKLSLKPKIVKEKQQQVVQKEEVTKVTMEDLYLKSLSEPKKVEPKVETKNNVTHKRDIKIVKKKEQKVDFSKKHNYNKNQKRPKQKREVIVAQKNDTKKDIAYLIKHDRSISKEMFDIVSESEIKILRSALQSMLKPKNIVFNNIGKFTLEFVKIQHYLKKTFPVHKTMIANEKEAKLIVGITFIKDACVAAKLPFDAVIKNDFFETILKHIPYKKRSLFQDFFEELEFEYKTMCYIQQDMSECLMLENTLELITKYALLNTTLEAEELYTNAILANTVKENDYHKYIITLISQVKKLVMLQLSSRSNLEWILCKNRLKIIRNRISNSESIRFNEIFKNSMLSIDDHYLNSNGKRLKEELQAKELKEILFK